MAPMLAEDDYKLDDQAGFLLRKAYQRHMTIFADYTLDGLTSMQFSTLYRLATEPGPISQNALGRLVAMDAATTKGVVSRLIDRGLVESERDLIDKRRYILRTTPAGREMLAQMLPVMKQVTAETMKPLSDSERAQLMALLRKIS